MPPDLMDDTLNTIILTGTMLENLYGHALVDIQAEVKPPKRGLKYLGNHAKRVTVLVNNSTDTFLPEDQLSFLNKMLLACRMNTGDVAILNMASGASLDDILSALEPLTIITFGVVVDPQVSPFMVGSFGHAALLQSPDLQELISESAESKLLKGRLWTCLKNLFGIS